MASSLQASLFQGNHNRNDRHSWRYSNTGFKTVYLSSTILKVITTYLLRTERPKSLKDFADANTAFIIKNTQTPDMRRSWKKSFWEVATSLDVQVPKLHLQVTKVFRSVCSAFKFFKSLQKRYNSTVSQSTNKMLRTTLRSTLNMLLQ